MPFINGRYYINPTMGAALDAARAADEARGQDPSASYALEPGRDGSADRDAGPWRDDEPTSRANGPGPIHHIEIEAAEVVPAHSGRAARGFVARVHRVTPAPTAVSEAASSMRSYGSASPALRPETHVFSDHRDLLDFLLQELSSERPRASS